MEALQKFNGHLRKLEEVLIVATVYAMAVLLIGTVISRKVFQSSWTFSEEVGGYLMVWITYIGSIYAARYGKHIVMNLLIDKLGDKGKKRLTIVTSLITGGFLLYVTYLSIEYVVMVYSLQRITPALRIPMWMMLVPMVFGLLMTAVQFLMTAVMNLLDKEEVYIGSERRLSDKDDVEVTRAQGDGAVNTGEAD